VDYYLVRHGDAVAASVDQRRPLSLRGREEVEMVAREALARNVRVAAICHSGILRAKQTAEIIARYLAPPEGIRELAGLHPEDDPAFGKAELEAADEPVMLVGHLPYMSRLAGLLVSGDPARPVIEFSPAAIVCCSKAGTQWQIGWHIAPPR
jgi:phosphohistidine phosphatase